MVLRAVPDADLRASQLELLDAARAAVANGDMRGIIVVMIPKDDEVPVQVGDEGDISWPELVGLLELAKHRLVKDSLDDVE